jgi:hypothetical protein
MITDNERPPDPPTEGGTPDAVGLLGWVRSDARMAEACAAAVEPLEVAARLETFGLSSRVAVETFGYPDVFSAAHTVYTSIPFQDVEPPRPTPEPMGRPFDLLRGALYAIPAIFFTVLVSGFRIPTRWWVLPVGLTVAWGLSQAVAVIGWALRGRTDDRSDSLLACSSILATAAVCLGVAVVLRSTLGGTEACVVVAVALGAYIAASGVLLFHRAELFLGLAMLPAAIGSILGLGAISRESSAWCVVASAGLVLLAALRPIVWGRWQLPTLSSTDWQRAGQFLVYGLGCGLLTSVVVGFGTGGTGAGDAIVIAVVPLLLTLGLMEWHLRSFRSRAIAALSTSTDLATFARRVHLAIIRSVGTYVVALIALSVVVLLVSRQYHTVMAPLLLGTVDALGVSFFLALLLASSGQINRVLVAWGATFAVLGATLLITWAASGRVSATAGISALLLAVVVAIITLAGLSRHVLSSPLSY